MLGAVVVVVGSAVELELEGCTCVVGDVCVVGLVVIGDVVVPGIVGASVSAADIDIDVGYRCGICRWSVC